MKHIRAMLIGAALLTGTATFAAAQAVVPMQRGWQRDYDDRQAFNDGFQQGQWDAQHNRRFDAGNNRWSGDDRDAYRAGYERGFRGFGGPGFMAGGYGGYGTKVAREAGFQDGINDGASDRRTGHSNRPTHGGNYKHADRGYIPTYGNKSYYKQEYREAYYKGYEQGYSSDVYYRR